MLSAFNNGQLTMGFSSTLVSVTELFKMEGSASSSNSKESWKDFLLHSDSTERLLSINL